MNDRPSHVGFVLCGSVLLPLALLLSWITDRDRGFVQRAALDASQRDGLLGFVLAAFAAFAVTAALGSLFARTRVVVRFAIPFALAAGLGIALFWFRRQGSHLPPSLTFDAIGDARADAVGGATAAVAIGSFVASVLATVACLVDAIDARRAARAAFGGRAVAVFLLTLVLLVVGFNGFRIGDGLTLTAFPAVVGALAVTLGDRSAAEARARAGAALLHAMLAILVLASAFGVDQGRPSRFGLALVPLALLLAVAPIAAGRGIFTALGSAARANAAVSAIVVLFAIAPWVLRPRLQSWLRAPLDAASVTTALHEGLGSTAACAELVADDVVAIRKERILVGGRDVGSITILDDDAQTTKLVGEHAPAERDVWLELDPQTTGARFRRLLRALEVSRSARLDDALVSSSRLPLPGCALHVVGRRGDHVVCDSVTLAVRACIPQSGPSPMKVLEITPSDSMVLRTRSLDALPTDHRTLAIERAPRADLGTALGAWWASQGSHRIPTDPGRDQLVLDWIEEPAGDALARVALARTLRRTDDGTEPRRAFYQGALDAAFDVTLGSGLSLARRPAPPPPIELTDDDARLLEHCRWYPCSSETYAAGYRAEAERYANKTNESAIEDAADSFARALVFDPKLVPRTNDPSVLRAFAMAKAHPRRDFTIEKLTVEGMEPGVLRASLEALHSRLRMCTNQTEGAAQIDFDGSVIPARGCIGDHLALLTFEPRETIASFHFTLVWTP